MPPNKTAAKGPPGSLPWPPLITGTLIRRYKRFLADVRLANGRQVTAHCANSGRMTACSQPGRPVYLSRHNRPDRKLKYTWEMIAMPASLVGVNTQVPNRLVASAIGAGRIASLNGYDRIRREVRLGTGTRIDLLLESDGRRPCYVEVKNCTLVVDGVARFPDAPTARGQKHLRTLSAQSGDRCRRVAFYLVQRMDAAVFEPADDIDPDYGSALRAGVDRGVEILVYDIVLNTHWIAVNRPVRHRLPA
jgi:sugar fermentation stimulation protein A